MMKTIDQMHQGDHLTLLHIFESWRADGYSRDWTYNNYLHLRGLRMAKNIRAQLLDIIDKQRNLKLRFVSSFILKIVPELFIPARVQN